MLVTMPRTMRQAPSTRGAQRTDVPGRLIATFALVGAGMMAAAVVMAVGGRSAWLSLGLAGALVQAGGFVGVMWWTVHQPPPRCDRRRP
jgi:hypothetical protein